MIQLHIFTVSLLRMSRASRPRAENKATATTTTIEGLATTNVGTQVQLF